MKFLVFCSLCLSFNGIAQSVNYNDVGVIVNLNSPESMQIGSYFQNARNIPTQNIIYVSVPTTEVINDAEFTLLRTQIENHLTSQNLQNQINYLVTTKGIPLKRNGFDCITNSSLGDCGSVDQELSLILGPHASGIGVSNGYNNPYYQENTHFTRAQFGIYLVSRLDGYAVSDVISLIDRSGPNKGVNQLDAQVVLDIFETNLIDATYFIDNYLDPSKDILQNNNWSILQDYGLGTPSNVQNALGYIGIGNGPTDSVLLNYEWLPGSFSSVNTCSAAQTFNAATNPDNKFLIANLIQDGCTAAHGYVNCVYLVQLLETDILLNRYLDPNAGFNLAESYFMAERLLSHQSVLIGDPKASILIDNTAGISKPTISNLTLYPNPSLGVYKFKGLENLSGELRIEVSNTYGQIVLEEVISAFDQQFTVTTPGIYFISILENDKLAQTFKLLRY
jgi:uncharacterized protein (TIGR03790 family)